MTPNEFFQSKAWDEATRAELDQRIRRVPQGASRARRFTEKAHSLFTSDDPLRQRAAIELLERALVESGCEGSDLRLLLQDIAQYRTALGDRAGAIAALRKCVALERSIHRRALAPEELLARLLRAQRDPAADEAYAAFYRMRERDTEGRWKLPSYDRLELRELTDRDPDAVAENICVIYEFAEDRSEPAVPGITNADRGSLVALDTHYSIVTFSLERKFHPRTAFRTDYLLGTFLPSLGAYLGRVLVHTAGAQWRVATPLMRSRVLIGKRAIDPFRAAYDAVYFDVPLAELHDRLVG